MTTRPFPQSLDSERAVLGALLLEPERLADVRDLLAHGDFSRPAHGLLWRWICHRADQGLDGSTAALADYLIALDTQASRSPGSETAPSQRWGGVAYATGLGSAVGNLAGYADRVREAAVRRRTLQLLARVTDRLHGPEALAEVLAEAEAGLRAASDSVVVGEGWTSAATVAEEVLDGIDADTQRRAQGAVLTLTTGIEALDREMGGLRSPDLVVVGGRPGMGKTSLAMGVALRAANAGGRVGFVSREMSRHQLGERALSWISGVPYAPAIRDRMLSLAQRDRLGHAAGDLASLPLWIEESAATADALRATAQRLHARQGLDLLIVDYVQRVSGAGETTAEQIGHVARTCKSLALDLGICVILLSQINRGGADREPTQSDLKGSGDLEQEADWIVAPWRPAAIDAECDPAEAWLLLLKARHGQSGARIPVRWDGPTMRYCDALSSDRRRGGGW